jgi:hypothetical protein
MGDGELRSCGFDPARSSDLGGTRSSDLGGTCPARPSDLGGTCPAPVHGLANLDPTLFLAVALLLLAVVAAASWQPAWRASRVDPNAILREE